MIRVPTDLLDAAVHELGVVADALDDVDDAVVDVGDLGNEVAEALADVGTGSRVARAGVQHRVRTLRAYCDAALRLAHDADATVITGRAP